MELRRNWRRIVGGVAFVIAVAWLAGRGACKSESAEATIRFRLGDAGREVRSLRAELYRGDDPEVLGFWEHNFDERGSGPVAGPWTVRADAGVYRLELVIRTAAATGRATRSIELREGASITVDITDALPAAR